MLCSFGHRSPCRLIDIVGVATYVTRAGYGDFKTLDSRASGYTMHGNMCMYQTCPKHPRSSPGSKVHPISARAKAIQNNKCTTRTPALVWHGTRSLSSHAHASTPAAALPERLHSPLGSRARIWRGLGPQHSHLRAAWRSQRPQQCTAYDRECMHTLAQTLRKAPHNHKTHGARGPSLRPTKKRRIIGIMSPFCFS